MIRISVQKLALAPLAPNYIRPKPLPRPEFWIGGGRGFAFVRLMHEYLSPHPEKELLKTPIAAWMVNQLR